MNILISLLAAIAVVPQPAKLVEKPGVCSKAEVHYVTDAQVPSEGYRLSVTPAGITITSSDAAGQYYAGVTLAQLAQTVGKTTLYPCVEIEDAPKFPWRGIHFDDCRHFFGKDTLKKTLDVMALHKMNRLHWHLTEDQGWRLDIPGYPELVKYGARRSASPMHGTYPKGWLSTEENRDILNNEPYGPYYYTEADIKEIIAYAAERHIQIVPEIELPGHVYAALAAYPEFACYPENLKAREPRLVWGIEKDVLCLGNDKAIKFMEDVLDYVCKLFPGDVVHIGGDECPQDRWKTCPKCQARIKEQGLKDEHDLQPWVTTHFVKFLEARGKRAIGWDEYLLGDVPTSAIGMSWRMSSKGGAGHTLMSPSEAAAKGHDMVLTLQAFCYLDYAQGLSTDPFQYINSGRCVTLEKAYSMDPLAGIAPEYQKHILGGQGNNWSEYTWGAPDLFWKMWPRASALAEVFWCGARTGRGDFEAFKKRMVVQRQRMIDMGVSCAPLD